MNGAPTGFEDPEDCGTVTLKNDQQLNYRSTSGVQLRFIPGKSPEDNCN